jgi:hypothetical protein
VVARVNLTAVGIRRRSFSKGSNRRARDDWPRRQAAAVNRGPRRRALNAVSVALTLLAMRTSGALLGNSEIRREQHPPLRQVLHRRGSTRC